MMGTLLGIAITIVAVLGALLYKIVYKARNSEHDDEKNKGIRG
ncbi:MAG: hypothetical protein ABI288_05065 [Ginsengibacter sp.]